jgi:hypothetical protein
MLDEGEDEAASVRFFDVLLALAAAIDDVRLAAQVDGDGTRFSLELRRQR